MFLPHTPGRRSHALAGSWASAKLLWMGRRWMLAPRKYGKLLCAVGSCSYSLSKIFLTEAMNSDSVTALAVSVSELGSRQ